MSDDAKVFESLLDDFAYECAEVDRFDLAPNEREILKSELIELHKKSLTVKTNNDFRVVGGLFAAIKANDYQIDIHRDHISATTYLDSGMEDRYEFSTPLDLEAWLEQKGYIS